MSKFKESEIARFWATLGLQHDPTQYFRAAIEQAVADYTFREPKPFKITSKERTAAYNRLENAIKRITNQLSDPEDWLSIELAETSMDFEPENFGDPDLMDMGEYEGLDYSDIKRHVILDQLTELADIASRARVTGTRKRGREKQNASLETMIDQLADIFTNFTGKSPHENYSFNPNETNRPYTGGFFDFAYDVIWTLNAVPFLPVRQSVKRQDAL